MSQYSSMWVCLFFLAGSQVCAAGVRSLSGDCDNSGVVDLADYADFSLAARGPDCSGAIGCQCYDIDDDGCVDLHDFGMLQIAFGQAQDTSGPVPSNIFVLQLADYHAQCSASDGGDGVCHVGDPCCQNQTGNPALPCGSLRNAWINGCDANSDGHRDRRGELNTLAEWNDFFWEPDDACNLLAREQYPVGPRDNPYLRHFIPMCTDGSTPPKGVTVCSDSEPIIQCTDGTRPVFYYHPGTVDRWMIKIQGGGPTCSAGGANDCWSEADRLDFSSAWSSNGLTKAFRGIYNIPDSHFASYNLVVMDKCVGDRNYGANTIPLQEYHADDGTVMGEGPAYFHGFREVKALLARISHWVGRKRLPFVR